MKPQIILAERWAGCIPVETAGTCVVPIVHAARYIGLGLALLLVLYLVFDFFVIDKCLDRGGAWDYGGFRCDQ